LLQVWAEVDDAVVDDFAEDDSEALENLGKLLVRAD